MDPATDDIRKELAAFQVSAVIASSMRIPICEHATCSTCWGLEQPHDLSVIRQPVLVANGESDRMVPTTNSLDLARRLPDSDLVIYPDAGHGGIFQFHGQFVAKALEFLQR